MKTHLESGQLLATNESDEELPLRNSFTGKTATPQQQQDLLGFRVLGQEDFNTFVEYTYLKVSSVKPSTRRHNLKTFSTAKVGRQVKQLQKEKNLVTKCLKSRLLLAQTREVSVRDEQYIEIPRAIADENGLPHKGQKSHATSFISRRYEHAILQCYTTMLPTRLDSRLCGPGRNGDDTHNPPKDPLQHARIYNLLDQKVCWVVLQGGSVGSTHCVR